MCLFSFEPGNCALPRANGTQASKDLSSVCNLEPSNIPQVPQLSKIQSHRASHHISTGSMCNHGGQDPIHLRIFLQRKGSRLKASVLIGPCFQLHSSSLKCHTRYENLTGRREKNQLSNMFSDFPQVQIQQTRYYIKVKLFTHYMTCPCFFFLTAEFHSTKILFQKQGCKPYS